MDPTATPWRVLEDPPDRVVVAPTPVATTRVIPRSALLISGGAGLLAILAFVLAFGSGAGGQVLVDGGTPLEPGPLMTSDESITGPGAGSGDPQLVVEIVGAVIRPGVFRLPAGSRVGDLVAAAGGYGARVDTDQASRELNLAAPLRDGDQVRVPSRDDEETAANATAGGRLGSAGTSALDAGGPLDLNLATSAELEALPGIGPVTAGKILTSREEQPFAEVQDLRTRALVGEKTFEKLKDLVTVR